MFEKKTTVKKLRGTKFTWNLIVANFEDFSLICDN